MYLNANINGTFYATAKLSDTNFTEIIITVKKKQFLILGPFNSFVLPSYVSCVKGQAKHLIEESK